MCLFLLVSIEVNKRLSFESQDDKYRSLQPALATRSEVIMPKVNSILSTYLHLDDSGDIRAIPVTESFWQALASDELSEFKAGRLLSAFSFSEPWSSWERHPAGEELVMLLTGDATLILEDASGKQSSIRLHEPGCYVLIPKNQWHTAIPIQPTTLLFLTQGAGTEHRDFTTKPDPKHLG